ncbi:hypothetical protein LF63_0109530 [Oleiagrimonas soli]|uniref:LysM domain-containing protein n=1 Tax=Oleiagrimonas soli TaxID=1543381 RepID=A0A099CVJ1_9GAMM|nr:hypothetical protein LF63_0109530 [Oleiagrimonas soli]
MKTIIARQLQVGHYAEGRKELRRYLQAHPEDRYARDLWRQLTVDPDKLLGKASKIHVVQAGESYGSLAARYLGSASRFLALARYNHAANPSVLQLGEKLRVPAKSPDAVKASIAAAPVENPSTPAVTESPSETPSAAAAPASEAPQDRAEALQRQSLALLHEGHKQQALDRLGQALTLDPKLKPSGNDAGTLRQQLLASYHERAIVLYRDQKLDPAIALWNRVLAIDPDYEPAIIYRARARELKDRLKQL